jgi:hypothetical protein
VERRADVAEHKRMRRQRIKTEKRRQMEFDAKLKGFLLSRTIIPGDVDGFIAQLKGLFEEFNNERY